MSSPTRHWTRPRHERWGRELAHALPREPRGSPKGRVKEVPEGGSRAPGWVPEGSLAGFLGCVFEVWPAPGARENLQKCGGGGHPTFLKAFPEPRGRPLRYPGSGSFTGSREPPGEGRGNPPGEGREPPAFQVPSSGRVEGAAKGGSREPPGEGRGSDSQGLRKVCSDSPAPRWAM